MNLVITYPQENGVLAVITPTGDIPIEEVAQREVPAGVPFTIVDRSTLPDRYFREAWEHDAATGCRVNVERAKNVQRDVWRRMRAPMLTKLDLEVLKSVERGDAKRRRELSEQKQSLRDVTETELPDDLEAIRNTIPEILLP